MHLFEDEFLDHMKRLYPQQIEVGEIPSNLDSTFILPSQQRIYIQKNLSKAEKNIIQEWIHFLYKTTYSVSTQEETFQREIQQMWSGTLQGALSPQVKFYPWNNSVIFFLDFEVGVDEQGDDQAIKLLIQSYFQQDEKKFIHITRNQWLLFLPKGKGKEERSVLREEESYREMAEGLLEALINELGIEAKILIHPPIPHIEKIPSLRSELLYLIEIISQQNLRHHVFHTRRLAHMCLWMGLSPEREEEFVEQSQMGSLFQDEQLIKTVDAFFYNNLNISETARYLYIHRNTLLYRLERIKQETGLDIRSFEDAMLVKVALFFYLKRQVMDHTK